MNPRGPIYDTSAPRGKWQQRAAWTSVFLLGVTSAISFLVLVTSWEHAQATLYALAALWAIGAPLWFFFEYYYLYRVAAAPDSWELFKHGQQVAIAIWAGVTAVLYALGSSDLARPVKEKHECTIVLPASTADNPGAKVAVILECSPTLSAPPAASSSTP